MVLALVAVARAFGVTPDTTELIRLSTRGRVPQISARALHAFVATPAHWPEIVLSSFGVDGARAESPLRRGDAVDEIFGLPPVWPLRVTWRCAAADARAGVLDVRSADGVAGIARDCRMRFSVAADGDGAVVDLEMSYRPASPLARLAAPALALDNYIALNALLPRAVAARGRR